MNTVQKGDEFEQRTYNLLSLLLKNSDLKLEMKGQNEYWIVPSSASIQKKVKKQFPWGDTVINDLSIEGKDNQLKFLILVECKSYNNHNVDRGEIAEFITRITDLNATKGIFITTSKFQTGAINMAKHHNVALIRVNKENKLEWDLHRIGNYNILSCFEAYNMLCNEINNDVIAIDGNQCYKSISDYFCQLLDIAPGPLAKYLPYLDDNDIEIRVKDFLCQREYALIDNLHLNFYCLKSSIIIKTDSDTSKYLGQYDFINNKITISNILEDDEFRKRFTIAHEIGHAMLHRQALKNFITTANDLDIDNFNYSLEWEKRLELQANRFAAYLLMPKIAFINVAMEVKGKLGIPIYRPFYLDRQECNIRDCKIAFTTLSKFFKVSIQAVKIRLLQEHLLEEEIYN